MILGSKRMAFKSNSKGFSSYTRRRLTPRFFSVIDKERQEFNFSWNKIESRWKREGKKNKMRKKDEKISIFILIFFVEETNTTRRRRLPNFSVQFNFFFLNTRIQKKRKKSSKNYPNLRFWILENCWNVRFGFFFLLLFEELKSEQ